MGLAKTAEPFVCGGSAATFASVVIHPIDLAKVRFSSDATYGDEVVIVGWRFAPRRLVPAIQQNAGNARKKVPVAKFGGWWRRRSAQRGSVGRCQRESSVSLCIWWFQLQFTTTFHFCGIGIYSHVGWFSFRKAFDVFLGLCCTHHTGSTMTMIFATNARRSKHWGFRTTLARVAQVDFSFIYFR